MAQDNVYLNGKILPADRAGISVSDAGFLHGASVFTTMRARSGVVFRLDRHLKRLLGTAKILGLQVAGTAKELAAATYQLLRANELPEARVRITLSPGSARAGGPTVLITADPPADQPDEWYEKGLTVVVTALRQVPGNPAYGFKTGCYLARVLARQEAAGKAAAEALWFTTGGHLAEACFCNVFLVAAGTLHTPPLETPVLPGIVREAVLELAEALAIPADDGTPLTVREMLAAEEVFLTSSCAGVRPVVRIEGHAVGDERPGPVTRRIMAAYRALLDRECAPPAPEADEDARRADDEGP